MTPALLTINLSFSDEGNEKCAFPKMINTYLHITLHDDKYGISSQINYNASWVSDLTRITIYTYIGKIFLGTAKF
jgi:hypothetical protein